LLFGLLSVFLLLSLALPVPAQEALDVQITIYSYGGSQPDVMAVAYGQKVPDADIRQDFANLARDLGIAPPKVTITREGGIPVGDAELTGLANWTTGAINLDPLIRHFRRFGRFRAVYLFFGNFPLRPVENVDRPPLRIRGSASGNTADYQIWVDQSGGVPAAVPSAFGVEKRGPDWKLALAAAAMVAVVVLSIFLIVNVILAQRRAAEVRGGR
jgi:hypothetical protein